MTEERLAQIEALLAAATPGPWYCESAAGDDPSQYTRRVIPDILRWGGHEQMRNSLDCDEDDGTARFIAAAPTVVAELLAEIRWFRVG